MNHQDGKLITVFSAPNYCDAMGNQGAYIRFVYPSLSPQIEQFEAVPHPKLPPMVKTRQILIFATMCLCRYHAM